MALSFLFSRPAPALLAGVGAALALSSMPALAQHAAHEHGVARLSVALDGRELLIELVTPLDNLVGFEHAPTNDAQRHALVEAEAALQDGARLFLLPAASACVQREVAIENPWPDTGHDHDHADAHEDEHMHEAGGDGEPKSGHADLVATYQFECAQPAALDALDVRLFERFPRLRELRAERATPGGQGATVLRPDVTVLGF